MKTNKKLLLVALSATLATTLTSGVMLTSFADEATKDHEFDARNDVVFENFDRADISNTVAAEQGVNLGEKPYLHVEYAALTAETSAGDRISQIYKQGSGSLAKVKDGGTITLTMRAPEGDVTLSELNFAARGVDNDAQVLVKGFDELVDSDADSLPELTTEWQTYEISFANSYEETDVYPNTQSPVIGTTSPDLLGIHIFADDGETGTLEIASISYATTGSALLNDFIGGENVQDTAKAADSGTWWAGSSTGYIVKRVANMTGGSFTVVKDQAVGDYSYAVIEADGDVANLKVATTTDGTTWGEAVAYDGYSVALNGNEKGFKFIYEGEANVTVKNIYLTNVAVVVPATAVPVIDAASAEVLEDFSVAQSGFTGVWEDMSTAPQLAEAGLDYRLSYNNGDKAEVKDGNLVFNATELGEGDYINYKFKSKTAAQGDYVVLKVKAEDGADLTGLRFNLGNPDDAYGQIKWSNEWKAGVQYPAALLENNPYTTADGWNYVVIDIDQTGFGVFEAGYCGMDMYYSGAGKLYIDCIFFADKLANIENDVDCNTHTVDAAATADYTYEWLEVNNEAEIGQTLSFDITAKEDDFNVSNLRFGIGDKVLWASENAEGTLITTEGKKLNELTYAKDVPTHIEINLADNGIGAFGVIHVHRHDMKAFTLDNIVLHTSIAPEDVVDYENPVLPEASVDFTANAEGYQYAGWLNVSGSPAVLEFTITPNADNFDVSGIRMEMGGGTFWASQNDQGVLKTTDGKLLSELTYTKGEATKVVLDLKAMGITALDGAHVHTNGTGTGSFAIGNVKLYGNSYYAQQMEALVAALDTVKPTVSITTATTAKVGDEVTVTYTASDNMTAEADLNVTVTVTKDGEAVALTDNKFTAQEGVYTVNVTVRDANGNEASATIQITVEAEEVSSGCFSTVSGTLFAGLALMSAAIFATKKGRKE